jgi:hypothetical protein
MHDAIFVDILYSCEYLLHKVDCFLLIKSFFFDYVIEEFSSFSIFHNEVNICFSLYDLHVGLST